MATASAATARPNDLDYRPSYLAASIAGAAIFLLYIVTLAPSTAMWDTSEYIAAAYTLGLPHPPGNPLFVLIGRVFSILPIAPTVAMRINVLAALCSAIASAMWFLVTERVLVGWFPERWQRIVAGSLSVLIGGTAFTVWNQSVVNEKVYTVSLAGIAIISWLMIRWSDDPDGPRADRLLVLVAYLLGLGYGNHMAGMLPAPAVAFAVLMRRPRTILRWQLLIACAIAIFGGLSTFATQPIRAAYFPPINEGEPTACRDGLKVSCTLSSKTYDAFMYNFNRGQYGKPALTDRQAPFPAQVGMWWFYFKWQWLRDAHLDNQVLQSVLAAVFLVLGLFGGWVHWDRDRRSFWYFGSLVFLMSLALIYYLNFKYGASQDPDLGDTVAREVRDRDYFYLWSFSAWGVWAALGLCFIWESLAAVIAGTETAKVGRESITVPSRRGLLYGSPVLAVALVPLFGNWHSAPRKGQTYTRDFAHDLLESVEPYGVLVTVGDNDTFPLWYAQEVEGIRKDVIVANTSLLNTDWYVRQLIRRPVYEYDAAKGPAIYRGKNWVKPTGSPVNLTLDQADGLPEYVPITRTMMFKAGGDSITATIDPRNFPEGILQKADIVVLRMIADSWGKRPIYFSRTSGSYARQLGLGDNVLTQGLASKVFIPPKAATPDTVAVQGDGWFDVQRSKSLWTDVFEGPQSVIRAGDWIDRPSVGIPYLYVATGIELSELLGSRGDPKAAQQVQQTSVAVAHAVRLDDLVQRLQPQQPIQLPSGDSTAGLVPAKPKK